MKIKLKKKQIKLVKRSKYRLMLPKLNSRIGYKLNLIELILNQNKRWLSHKRNHKTPKPQNPFSQR